MATTISKANLLQVIAKRGYAAVPQAAVCSGKLEVSKLPNKTVVASLGCGPKSLVKVAVAFRAGSRYESADNYGASHLIRSCAGLSTGCATSFSIQRNLQQLGSNLTTLQDRETIVYILESTCNNISASLEYLRLALTNQEFRPWELSDNVPRVLNELHTLPLQAQALNLIHQAAFRTGLGNSLFAKPYNVQKLGSETLQHFASSYLVGDRAAVTGCGLPHSQLSDFAESLELKSGGGQSDPASKYYGGEVRYDKPVNQIHAVLAGEAPGLNSGDVLASAVARFALGSGPSVKYGSSSGPLGKISGNCSAASALSIAHSDAGLLGVYVAAAPSEIKQALEGASQALKAGVSDQDIERGKAQLRSAILFASDSCQGIVEDLAGQSLLVGSPKTPSELAEEVSKVSAQQVIQVLKTAAGGKRSLAVIGNSSSVPYLDEL